ncbi:gfo/Idh/MocA family oxidoreductase [Flavobacterium cheongpyeongense]|uniref:Gfo/Idh/MocA family oxidoreductase n=1 Tax=Flavobacterium cheongpyeongense TaxID=2212651 RepID=A0A2V4BLU2_9FLAO|nr:Gfo/Idh/MocA family oxidoreductase [Flavobacterium cheongpyeongense]PXY38963.1 gfo/Idh/MocA family oxidoreductase [Flavobacterium cheongpyeongense]
MSGVKKIRWGIIGLGNIANQFAADLELIEDAELYAVASRDITKANEFAKKYDCNKYYGSYNDLFEDDNIDVVYIATPHNSHTELSILAMKNGKHVLCEKPLSLSYSDAFNMIEASKKYNKFFMEAFWTRFIPSIKELLSKVKNGEIGEIKYLKADFAYYNNELAIRLTDKKLGGGALYDIGVYPLFISYLILGIPEEIISKSTYHTTGVDLQTTMILQYPSSQSVLHAGLVSASDMKATISGTKGRIDINSPWFMTEGYSIIKDGQEEKFKIPNIGKGYAHEAIECHNCIRENQIESQFWSHQNSLDLSSMVEKVKNQIGLEFH